MSIINANALPTAISVVKDFDQRCIKNQETETTITQQQYAPKGHVTEYAKSNVKAIKERTLNQFAMWMIDKPIAEESQNPLHVYAQSLSPEEKQMLAQIDRAVSQTLRLQKNKAIEKQNKVNNYFIGSGLFTTLGIVLTVGTIVGAIKVVTLGLIAEELLILGMCTFPLTLPLAVLLLSIPFIPAADLMTKGKKLQHKHKQEESKQPKSITIYDRNIKLDKRAFVHSQLANNVGYREFLDEMTAQTTFKFTVEQATDPKVYEIYEGYRANVAHAFQLQVA